MKRTIVAAIVVGIAAIPVMAYSRSGESAAPPPAQARVVPDDTASLARLLRVVRGVDPLLCELATRNVDMHGWWSRWGGGPGSGSPLEMDSTAASIIAWIQHDHNDPRVVPGLSAALRDTDRCVRRIAASFLGRVKHPSAVAALVAALDDANAGTRMVAALGLGLSEEPGALQPLIRRLHDPSADVRRAAAWGLGALENSAALPQLIEALEGDADARVRQAAAWSIGRVTG